MVAINSSDIFEFSHVSKTRGHAYKLFKWHSNNSTRYRFFAERVVSVWNSLPASVNFSTLGSFKRSITNVDGKIDLKKLCDGWAVTFGSARKGLGGAAARSGPSSLYQMKQPSVPITVLLYNGPLLCGFSVPV